MFDHNGTAESLRCAYRHTGRDILSHHQVATIYRIRSGERPFCCYSLDRKDLPSDSYVPLMHSYGSYVWRSTSQKHSTTHSYKSALAAFRPCSAAANCPPAHNPRYPARTNLNG